MSWAVGWSQDQRRWIGYGVPAYCDHIGCTVEIDRGLGHCCGGEPGGGEHGCGLFFCADHLEVGAFCHRCLEPNPNTPPFEPTPEHPDWLRHVLSDPSWGTWRHQHAAQVEVYKAMLMGYAGVERFLRGSKES